MPSLMSFTMNIAPDVIGFKFDITVNVNQENAGIVHFSANFDGASLLDVPLNAPRVSYQLSVGQLFPNLRSPGTPRTLTVNCKAVKTADPTQQILESAQKTVVFPV